MLSKNELSMILGITFMILVLLKIDEIDGKRRSGDIPVATLTGNVKSIAPETVRSWEEVAPDLPGTKEIAFDDFIKEDWKEVKAFRSYRRESIVLFGVKKVNGEDTGFMARKPLNLGLLAEIYNIEKNIDSTKKGKTISVHLQLDRQVFLTAIILSFSFGFSIPRILAWLWKELVAALKR